MFDEYLKTFICAAECGSFAKAAEALYLSPNAVKKRIGCLEENLGFPLFDRNLKGIKLTPAGKSFYSDSKNLVQNYNSAVEKAKSICEKGLETVKIGIMDTFADEFMTAEWFGPAENFEKTRTGMVFFGTASNNFLNMLKSIGEDIDIAVDVFDEKLAKKHGIKSLKTSDARICCAVPPNHRLAGKSEILPSDLCGEKVAVLKSGRSELWDGVMKQIKEDYFGLEFFEIEKYNIKAFNRCEIENRIMLITENCGRIYPFCKIIPLGKTYKIPFGLYYSPNSSQRTLDFIKKIKNYTP